VADLTDVQPPGLRRVGLEAPPDAKGWQSQLGYDLWEDEWPEAFVFCPECTEREFGIAPTP